MPLHKLGKLLLVGLGLLALESCRDSVPPAIEICIGNGVGGADCVESSGKKKYRLPSELTNYWMTSQPDMKNFSSWCYDIPADDVQKHMDRIEAQARE